MNIRIDKGSDVAVHRQLAEQILSCLGLVHTTPGSMHSPRRRDFVHETVLDFRVTAPLVSKTIRTQTMGVQPPRSVKSPAWRLQVEFPGEPLRCRCEVGVFHVPEFGKRIGQTHRYSSQRAGSGLSKKGIQKIPQTQVEGLSARCQFCDFRQSFRNHILPSSNRPSIRYWAFTGILSSG